MLQLLKETVSSRHAERLETIVIWLIVVEIGECLHCAMSTPAKLNFRRSWYYYYPCRLVLIDTWTFHDYTTALCNMNFLYYTWSRYATHAFVSGSLQRPYHLPCQMSSCQVCDSLKLLLCLLLITATSESATGRLTPSYIPSFTESRIIV